MIAWLVVAPFLVLIALLIKLTSPGPVFYVSKRVGRFNKPFTFVKFRTMVVSADQQRKLVLGEGVAKNLDNYLADNRITGLGKILRRWSIVEFPQFIHVLTGKDVNCWTKTDTF